MLYSRGDFFFLRVRVITGAQGKSELIANPLGNIFFFYRIYSSREIGGAITLKAPGKLAQLVRLLGLRASLFSALVGGRQSTDRSGTSAIPASQVAIGLRRASVPRSESLPAASTTPYLPSHRTAAQKFCRLSVLLVLSVLAITTSSTVVSTASLPEGQDST